MSSASIRPKASSPSASTAGVGLDRAGQVADVEEDRLAVAAAAGQAPGDPVGERQPASPLRAAQGHAPRGSPRSCRGLESPLSGRGRSLPPAAARASRDGRSRSSPAKARPSQVPPRSWRQADRDPLVAHVVGARRGVAQQLAHRRAVVGVVLERQPPAARRFGDQAANDVQPVLTGVAGNRVAR